MTWGDTNAGEGVTRRLMPTEEGKTTREGIWIKGKYFKDLTCEASSSLFWQKYLSCVDRTAVFSTAQQPTTADIRCSVIRKSAKYFWGTRETPRSPKLFILPAKPRKLWRNPRPLLFGKLTTWARTMPCYLESREMKPAKRRRLWISSAACRWHRE